MYVNYLTLPLLAVAGILLLGAWYVLKGEASVDGQQAFASAFGAGGLILAVTGFHISLTWPIPGQYNIAFGEPLAYFGTLLVFGSIALGRGVDITPIAILAAFGGVANIFVAAAILAYRMTLIPAMAAIMFGASGLSVALFPFRAKRAFLRLTIAVLLVIAGLLFMLTACMSYIGHLAPGEYGKWTPVPMRGAAQE